MRTIVLVAVLFIFVKSIDAQQSEKCQEDILEGQLLSNEFRMIFLIAAFHVLILSVNVAIMVATCRFIKPAVNEMRKLTFYVMDNVMMTSLPESLRPPLGCVPEPRVEDIMGFKDTGSSKRTGGSSGRDGTTSTTTTTMTSKSLRKTETVEMSNTTETKAGKKDNNKKKKDGKK